MKLRMIGTCFGLFISSAFYATDECQKVRIADLNDDGRMDVVGIGWGTDEMRTAWSSATSTATAGPTS